MNKTNINQEKGLKRENEASFNFCLAIPCETFCIDSVLVEKDRKRGLPHGGLDGSSSRKRYGCDLFALGHQYSECTSRFDHKS